MFCHGHPAHTAHSGCITVPEALTRVCETCSQLPCPRLWRPCDLSTAAAAAAAHGQWQVLTCHHVNDCHLIVCCFEPHQAVTQPGWQMLCGGRPVDLLQATLFSSCLKHSCVMLPCWLRCNAPKVASRIRTCGLIGQISWCAAHLIRSAATSLPCHWHSPCHRQCLFVCLFVWGLRGCSTAHVSSLMPHLNVTGGGGLKGCVAVNGRHFLSITHSQANCSHTV
jgi:hypothetical protein